MSPLSLDDARRMSGETMMDSSGGKVGKIADIYIDKDTQQPEWALVSTGKFGGRENFVPLAESSMSGDDLTVPYTKDQISNAPSAEPDGELSQEEEAALYRHYGLGYSESQSDSGLPTAGTATGTTTERSATTSKPGRDVRGTTDDAMTRSEERLKVGVVKKPSQLVRLRKHIVTENVTQTVPVTTERVRVDREQITEANRDKAMDGPEITEAEHEITLMAERPVVTKETVPVERVRVAKESVTTQETVGAEVRKEQIEVEEPTDRTARTDRTKR